MVEDTSPNNALLSGKSGGSGGISIIGSSAQVNATTAGGQVRVQIVPAQPKTLSHLPSRPAVDLAFHDLRYSVREGRRNRECTMTIILFKFLLEYFSFSFFF